MMKISIVTSCLNREKTIGQSILSVLCQDHPLIEYVVVDGVSRDHTVEVARQTLLSLPYPEILYRGESVQADWLLTADASVWREGFEVHTDTSTITIRLISDPDHGMYEAINKGIALCTGEVIGLVHSDDTISDRSVLSDYARYFEQTGADIIYADGTFVSNTDEQHIVRYWQGGRFAYWKLYLSWLPLHPTTYIRRSIYEHKGLYDTQYKIAADTDLLIRFLSDRSIKVAYMAHRNVVKMKMGGLSTDKRRRNQMWKEDIDIFRRHHFLFPRLAKLLKMAWKVPQLLIKKKHHPN